MAGRGRQAQGTEAVGDDPKPSNIVPFGKYKGRLIEDVLDDPAFLSWAV
jgi:hypothetical protein